MNRSLFELVSLDRECETLGNKYKFCYKTIIRMNGSSSNPSDYEFLLRTLSEGNHVAKA